MVGAGEVAKIAGARVFAESIEIEVIMLFLKSVAFVITFIVFVCISKYKTFN
jgi:hypothetical protein